MTVLHYMYVLYTYCIVYIQRMKFYWRLDTKCLTLYKSETSSHYHRDIQLADMLAVDQMVTSELYPLTPPHVFEIVTSAMTYYVGVDMTGALPSDLKTTDPIDRKCVCVCVCVVSLLVPYLTSFSPLPLLLLLLLLTTQYS